MSMASFEIDVDEDTGFTTVSITDVPDDWTYSHEYGRLTIHIPPKLKEDE